MKKITTAAKVESIEAVTNFVDRELEARDCPVKPLMQIRMAIDELVTNVDIRLSIIAPSDFHRGDVML